MLRSHSVMDVETCGPLRLSVRSHRPPEIKERNAAGNWFATHPRNPFRHGDHLPPACHKAAVPASAALQGLSQQLFEE